MKNISIILLLSLALSNCTEDTKLDNKPQLEITILDEAKESVSDAIVLIYDTSEDLAAQNNVIFHAKSNSEGIALITNLEERSYYFYIFKGELTNKRGYSYFEEPLITNVRSRLVVTIR